MRLSVICISTIIFFTSCGGAKTVELKSDAEPEKEVYLLIGEGGGFTGAYNEYIVYPNGRVEVWDELEQESIFKGNITKQEAAAIFDKWGEIGELGRAGGKPGNMNYRIGYYENGTVKTLRWSDSQAVEDSILEFYNSTYKLLRNAQ